MKKLFSTLITSVLFSLCGHAQIRYQKAYSTGHAVFGSAVRQTSDTGYISTGLVSDPLAGTSAIYLLKTNAAGDTLWTSTFTGGSVDAGNDVRQTTDGGYIIAGSTTSFGAGVTDAYLIKTNASGNVLWAKTYGGTSEDFASSVVQTTDGGFIFAGLTSSFGVAGWDNVYLVKTNATGDTQWTKTFYENVTGATNNGSPNVLQTNDGGYIVTSSMVFGTSGMYIIKTNPVGTMLWSKINSDTTMATINTIQQTADGGYIIGGTSSVGFDTGYANSNMLLLKIDNLGNALWSKIYGGSHDDYCNSARQTKDHGYIMAGYTFLPGVTNENGYLIKTDSIGNLVWSKEVGDTSSDIFSSVQQTNDGGFIVCGETNGFGLPDFGLYLLKTDNVGNSGCYQTTPITLSMAGGVILINPITSVSSGAIVGSHLPFFTKGSVVTNICSATTTEIENVSSTDNINVYPNPSYGKLTIEFPAKISAGTVTVFDIYGKTIFQENISNTIEKEIYLNNVSKGLYLIKINYDKGQIFRKVMLQ
jgi:TolB-like protein